MNIMNEWARNIKAAARTVTIFVFAGIVIGMSITPVLADERGKHPERREYQRHRHYERRHYEGREDYPGAVYAPPPPVVYAPPPPPPGISIVFPIHIR